MFREKVSRYIRYLERREKVEGNFTSFQLRKNLESGNKNWGSLYALNLISPKIFFDIIFLKTFRFIYCKLQFVKSF